MKPFLCFCIALCFAVAASGCPNTSVSTETPDEARSPSCKSACGHLGALGCADVAGDLCVESCLNSKEGPVRYDTACIVKASTCEQGDTCVTVKQ